MRHAIAAFLMLAVFSGCKQSSPAKQRTSDSVYQTCSKISSASLTSTIDDFKGDCVNFLYMGDDFSEDPVVSVQIGSRKVGKNGKPNILMIQSTGGDTFPRLGVHSIKAKTILDQGQIADWNDPSLEKELLVTIQINDDYCITSQSGTWSAGFAIEGTVEFTALEKVKGGAIAGKFDLVCNGKRIAGKFSGKDGFLVRKK